MYINIHCKAVTVRSHASTAFTQLYTLVCTETE